MALALVLPRALLRLSRAHFLTTEPASSEKGAPSG